MTGGAARYQLKLKPRCDHGWGTYAIRNRGKVCRMIGDHTVFISQPLRGEAKSLYEGYRRIMRAGRLEETRCHYTQNTAVAASYTFPI